MFTVFLLEIPGIFFFLIDAPSHAPMPPCTTLHFLGSINRNSHAATLSIHWGAAVCLVVYYGLRAEVSKPVASCFYTYNHIGTQSYPFIAILFMAAFTLQKQIWVVGTEIIWPSLKYFLPDFLGSIKTMSLDSPECGVLGGGEEEMCGLWSVDTRWRGGEPRAFIEFVLFFGGRVYQAVLYWNRHHQNWPFALLTIFIPFTASDEAPFSWYTSTFVQSTVWKLLPCSALKSLSWYPFLPIINVHWNAISFLSLFQRLTTGSRNHSFAFFMLSLCMYSALNNTCYYFVCFITFYKWYCMYSSEAWWVLVLFFVCFWLNNVFVTILLYFFDSHLCLAFWYVAIHSWLIHFWAVFPPYYVDLSLFLFFFNSLIEM